MLESTVSEAEPMVSNLLLQAEKDARFKVQVQLDICTWVLIALMRKHRYKQFTVTKELLLKIAEADMDLNCDDESIPGQLIITIDPKVKTDESSKGPVCEADSTSNDDGADHSSPVENESGLHQSSGDTGPSSND